MNHRTRALFLLLFAAAWSPAQTNKSQQPANTSPGGGTTVQIPAQLYPLERLPTTRPQAEANLKLNLKHVDRAEPHYVWYQAYETKSVATPLILLPMTCERMPWKAEPTEEDVEKLTDYELANYDLRFAQACKNANPKATPSQPSQNRNPLKLGDGLILAIYDPDSLLQRFAVREVGLTIQTSNGTVLNTDPVRPSFSASGGGNASPATPPPATGDGHYEDIIVNESPTGKSGMRPPKKKSEREILRELRRKIGKDAPAPDAPAFHYIAWSGNPLQGDQVVDVALTTQGPALVPLTVRTNAPRALITVTTEGQAQSQVTVVSWGTAVAVTSLPPAGGTPRPLTVVGAPGEGVSVASHTPAGAAPTELRVSTKSHKVTVTEPSSAEPLSVYSLAGPVTVFPPTPKPGESAAQLTVTHPGALVSITTPDPDAWLSVRTDASGRVIVDTQGQAAKNVSAPWTDVYPSGSIVKVRADPTAGNMKFLSWSDGVTDLEDTIAIGSSPITVTAEYVSTDAEKPTTVPVTVVTNPAGITFPSPSQIRVQTTAGKLCDGGPTVWLCHPDTITASAPANVTAAAPPAGTSSGFSYTLQGWSPATLCPMASSMCSVPILQEPAVLVANYVKSSSMPLSIAGNVVGAAPAGATAAGLLAAVNGSGYVIPQTVQAAPGDSLDIGVPSPQLTDAAIYTWTGWAGVTPGAPFVVPALPTTLTATFSAARPAPPNADQIQFTVHTSPSNLFIAVAGGASGPVFARDGSKVTAAKGASLTLDASLQQYLNGRLYKFQSWSDGKDPRHTISADNPPQNLTATFAEVTPPATSAIPVTITTDPPNLQFSVNGISQRGPVVAYFPPGTSVALNTSAVQTTAAGVQYTFSGWSDASGGAGGGGTASTAHNFTVGGSQPGNQQQQTGGGQSSPNTPLAASVTAVFTQSAPGPTEQSMTLLNTSYPQTHNLSRFNIASGVVASYLGNRSPSWSRVETAPAVTCPTGTPQPCIPSPALYQTVKNPSASWTYDPVLFFMIYPMKLDSERKWHPRDLYHVALDFGFSLSSPTTDFFVGASEELPFVRGVQITLGLHEGQVNELSPAAGVNDPTSPAAPVTDKKWHGFFFGGLTFNLNFIQTIFSGGKGGG